MNRWLQSSNRRGRVTWVTLVLGAGALFVGTMAWVYVPVWMNLYTVHETVRSAVLTWYATEEQEAAVDELFYELEKDGFDYIGEDECDVYPDGDLMVVECVWEYTAYYPMDMGYGHMVFSSKAEVDTTGTSDQKGGLREAVWFNEM